MSGSSVDSVLIRVQSKIESRTRRPWFDLQRGYYYKTNTGIRNIPELRAALEHFHVLLSDADYDLLFQSFQRPDGFFDFRTFAARLYPKDAAVQLIRDGRAVGTVGAASQAAANAQFNAAAAAAAAAAVVPPPGAIVYDEMTGKYSTLPAGAVGPLGSAGGAIVGSDVDYPVLGETLGPAGTTSYYTYAQPSNAAAAASVSASTKKRGTRAGAVVKARITYNRPSHQRFAESAFDDFASHEPVGQAYPEEEFKSHGGYASTLSKPRFDRRELPTFVDVARRHNISRQYRRNAAPKR